MLFKANSVAKELIIYSVITVAILLGGTAYFVVGHIADLKREQAYTAIDSQLELNSNKIENFFVERGRIVDAVFSSPMVINWFENYTERASYIKDDLTHQRITEHFAQLAMDDPTVKSVFFAPAQTHEYFDTKGRYDADPTYYTNKRPWWQEAIDQGQFFASTPSVDYVDGSVVSAVKAPIKDSNGNFLGFGGIDILISTIGDELSKMQYKGKGDAFLIAEDGSIVFLAGIEEKIQNREDKANEDPPLLNTIKSLYSDVDGFAEVQAQMLSQDHGFSEVTWKGQKHFVAFRKVTAKHPYFSWSLAMMIPVSVIEKPIQATKLTSFFAVVGIILLVSISSGVVARRIISPLGTLVKTMAEIASGEGDLTKRIEVDRQDELGQMGTQFNLFVEKIQLLIQQSKSSIDEVDASAAKVVDAITKAGAGARSQQQELELIATASTQMSQTVQGISQGTKRTTEFADLADNQASKGQSIVAESTASIEALSVAVDKAADVVDKLSQDSQSIGQVLEVIRNIAKQTNLLALNAAIEAARAGEQGRGFAVVADEVRSLAQRTQESTQSIQEIISGLQTNAQNAVAAMQGGQEKAAQGVQSSHAVRNILSEIANCIAQIRSQAEEIDTATSEQVKVSEEITHNVVNIRDLADGTVSQAEVVAATANHQQDTTKQLSSIINRFKV